MTNQNWKEYFHKIEKNFNQAVISNDVAEIKKCVTEDWVLVDTQSGIIPQEQFFQALEQGLLSHSSMTKEIIRVKVYGDMALVTGRVKNTGTWQGRVFEADEWVTDTYRKVSDQWLFVLTHTTPIKGDML